MFVLNDVNFDYVEYYEVELLDMLIKDSFYCVEFFLFYGNNFNGVIGQYGVLFMEEVIGDFICILVIEDNFMVINIEFQFSYRGDFLMDMFNWVFFCWVYQVQGGEKFMILGVFGLLEDLFYLGFGFRYYYYVDDVFVMFVFWLFVELILVDIVYWCSSEVSVVLSIIVVYGSYLWSIGEVSSSIIVGEFGWYWVEIYVLDCVLLCDSVWVVLLDEVVLDVGLLELYVCFEDFLFMLSIGFDLGSFSWSIGSIVSSIMFSVGGIYSVE